MAAVGLVSRLWFGRRVARAGALRRGGDGAGAVEELARLLDERPDDAAANVEMARALQVLGDASGAEEHYRRALAQSLDYTLVVELAETLAEQDRAVEAQETIDAALVMAEKTPRLDPGAALLVRATIAHAQGLDDDARAVLDRITGDRAVRKRSSRETLRYAERLREQLEPAP